MTEREQNCRKLAEWIEPLDNFAAWPRNCGIVRSPLGCWYADGLNRPAIRTDFRMIANFYLDEAASAMLLDRLLILCEATHGKQDGKGWFDLGNAFINLADLIREVRPSYYTLQQMDRKTAICEAALQYIDTGGEGK